MHRRDFLASALAAAAPTWGNDVFDIHLHPRRDTHSAMEHLQGSGMTRAALLTHLRDEARAQSEIAAHPKAFVWFAATDPKQPNAIELLRKAIESGAKGVGEMKDHLAADSPEMRKVYDLCAEMKVPITLHFGELPDSKGAGDFNTGFRTFDKVLKAHPRTKFFGHADFFWANISADYALGTTYPGGKIQKGGLTDRFLADYPNLYGDMSANSGNNALTRDPEFAKDFLIRHQDKLMFGSDCGCYDGNGAGGSPLLPRLKGKCTGHDTLEVLKSLTTPAVFRKVTWTNANRIILG
ncbi:amidohydrolase family protein [Bryobacter aggregatus]|uniref:amidohydrolase family protein n=1 Tax=Bryobacter aggregatus TaxID=360054 RepID=UPI0004E1BB9C|nr:amidohydrolase family protein [Bryobacter aggregatus]